MNNYKHIKYPFICLFLLDEIDKFIIIEVIVTKVVING
jgi:hypothetical protein